MQRAAFEALLTRPIGALLRTAPLMELEEVVLVLGRTA